MKIIVQSTATRRDEFTKGDGTIRVVHRQQAAIDTGEGFPLPFEVEVKPESPHPVGEYTFGPGVFRVSRYGGLEINPYGMNIVPLDKKNLKVA